MVRTASFPTDSPFFSSAQLNLSDGGKIQPTNCAINTKPAGFGIEEPLWNNKRCFQRFHQRYNRYAEPD